MRGVNFIGCEKQFVIGVHGYRHWHSRQLFIISDRHFSCHTQGQLWWVIQFLSSDIFSPKHSTEIQDEQNEHITMYPTGWKDMQIFYPATWSRTVESKDLKMSEFWFLTKSINQFNFMCTTLRNHCFMSNFIERFKNRLYYYMYWSNLNSNEKLLPVGYASYYPNITLYYSILVSSARELYPYFLLLNLTCASLSSRSCLALSIRLVSLLNSSCVTVFVAITNVRKPSYKT